MIKLPGQNSRKWSQPNNSDLFGNLFITKNMTFDEAGYMKLSDSPRCAMDETVDGDFELSGAIIYSQDYEYFDITWGKAFSIDEAPLSRYPTEIATAGVPTGDIQSDATFFGGLMVVTQDNDVDYYDPVANTWTDTNISLTTGSNQHPAVNFISRSALAIADVNTVKLYANPIDATPSLITTLTINSDFVITGMCYLNQRLYIATRNAYGGHAFLYVWNGLGTASQEAYEVDANIIFDVVAHRNSVVMLVSNGELMEYTGSGLRQLAVFPSNKENQNLTDYSNINMYKNTMKSNGDLLYINFSNFANTTQRLLSMPDGVWCYDPRVGLYHRYSNSISLMDIKSVDAANISAATDIITTTSVPPTGTEVYFISAAATDVDPLVDNTKYYCIKVSSTEMKLATTLANATAGTAINITSVGAGTHKFNCYPNIDYGSFFTRRTTAMNVIELTNLTPQYGVDLMWSGGIRGRDNSTVLDSLYTASPTLESRGYFISPRIFSTETTDTFNQLVLKFSKLINEQDKIIIKTRTTDDRKEVINEANWEATWTSSTTFTSTQTDLANAVVGDEIEFLRGAAGGLLAHITVISESSGTYTVTIDETFDNYVTGDKSVFIYRNWKKFKTITYGDDNANQGFIEEQLGVKGKFLQLKIELRGMGVRIEELLVDNIYRLPAK